LLVVLEVLIFLDKDELLFAALDALRAVSFGVVEDFAELGFGLCRSPTGHDGSSMTSIVILL
jgi:hypothetical protein